jgi:hypothetical protein
VTDPEPAILIASPERFGPPVVPSDRRRCERCLARVWVSKRGEAWAGRIMCVVCAMAMIRPSDVIGSAPWVSEDLEELEP